MVHSMYVHVLNPICIPVHSGYACTGGNTNFNPTHVILYYSNNNNYNDYTSFYLLLVHLPVLSSEYCNIINVTPSYTLTQSTDQSVEILFQSITTTEHYHTNTIVVTTHCVQDVSDSCNTQTGIMISS